MDVPLLQVEIRSMRHAGTTLPTPLIGRMSFSVAAGEVVAFLGPSGAGKTTLLRIVAGLETHFDGAVVLAGRDVLSPTRNVQLVFQDNRLLPWRTVKQNLEFARRDGADLATSEAVQKWLSTTKLEELLEAWPKTLSGGEEARVALARAFIDPPRVLLLDEPFRNLDLIVKASIQGELLNAIEKSGMASLLVSHSVDDAVLMSDRIFVLRSRPLSICQEIDNPVGRPRDPRDARLQHLSALATSALIAAGGGSSRFVTTQDTR